MSLMILLAQAAGRRSHKALTATLAAPVVADLDYSHLVKIRYSFNISNNRNKYPQPQTLDSIITNSSRRNYNSSTTAVTSHHRVLQSFPRTSSISNSTSSNSKISTSSPALRKKIPRCSGITGKNKPCQRDGINAVMESSTTVAIATNKGSNNTSNAVIQYFCYQHDPRLVATHRCLSYIASGRRQCRITCSKSEIRNEGRPICNTHFRPGARLIPRQDRKQAS